LPFGQSASLHQLSAGLKLKLLDALKQGRSLGSGVSITSSFFLPRLFPSIQQSATEEKKYGMKNFRTEYLQNGC
jgi:hypothetical protein